MTPVVGLNPYVGNRCSSRAAPEPQMCLSWKGTLSTKYLMMWSESKALCVQHTLVKLPRQPSKTISNSALCFIPDSFSWHRFVPAIFLLHYPTANLDTETVSVLLLSHHIQVGHRNRPPLLLGGNPEGLHSFLQCTLFLLISFPLNLSPLDTHLLSYSSLEADVGACNVLKKLSGKLLSMLGEWKQAQCYCNWYKSSKLSTETHHQANLSLRGWPTVIHMFRT